MGDKRLLVVDGNNIAHRARYKFELDNNGVDVSVTYGFLRMLLSYMRIYRPNAIIVCWDGGLPKYRRDIVPSYKSNRSHDNDDIAYSEFVRQVQELHSSILPSMGAMSVMRRYVEADDLVYNAALMADGYVSVIVVSNDMDLYQCLELSDDSTLVQVLNPHTNALVDRMWLEDKCGVPIDNYVAWRALQGDTSDAIAGASGIGPKTATKLFQAYKDASPVTSSIYQAAKSNQLGANSKRILDFGWLKWYDNISVMDLAYDRSGARKVLLDALSTHYGTNLAQFRQHLMRNAFISIMDGDAYLYVRALETPTLHHKGLRIPAICSYRTPWEGNYA